MDRNLLAPRENLLAGESHNPEWVLDVEKIIEVERGGEEVL